MKFLDINQIANEFNIHPFSITGGLVRLVAGPERVLVLRTDAAREGGREEPRLLADEAEKLIPVLALNFL